MNLRSALFLAMMALAGSMTSAQDADETGTETADPIDAFLDDQGRLKPPQILFLDHLDADGKTALSASLKEYYRYHETGYQHRRAVFYWQLLSSKIIFVVVIFLVALGVYFSWLQFMAGVRQSSAAAADPDKLPTPETPEPVTTFEASLQGVKVTSPVLGVIILVISLAFFYLYLRYIYPVTELF